MAVKAVGHLSFGEMTKKMVQTDKHGWMRSDAAHEDYTLTEKRKALMKQAIAMLHCEVILHIASENWDAGAVVSRDASDMMEIYSLMSNHKMRQAIDAYKNLDTAARDRFPQWVKEMAGSFINPKAWKVEESLDATR